MRQSSSVVFYMKKTTLLLGVLVLLILTGNNLFTLPVQSSSQWNTPINISLNVDAPSSNPRILADSSGVVHVFWEANVAHDRSQIGTDTIYYSRKLAQGWSEPVDILVSPTGGTINLGGVAIGPQGELVLLWSDQNSLFYSWSDPSTADSVKSWKTQVIYNGSVGWPGLYIDPYGADNVVWEDGFIVQYLRRENHNSPWSAPVTIWSAPINRKAIAPRLIVDGKHIIHVVWSENGLNEEQQWQTSGVWYSHSSDDGISWSNELYTPDRGSWANIALDDSGGLHLIWEHGVWSSEGRWHRYSSDGGIHWSPPELMFTPGPANGLTRWPLLASDSAHQLHYITPFNAITLGDNNYGGGILHSEWSGRGWINIEVIPGALGEFADFVITQGNTLHVVYHNVVGDKKGIWYTTRTVDAPQVASIAQNEEAVITPESMNMARTATSLAAAVTPTVNSDARLANKNLPKNGSEPVLLIVSIIVVSIVPLSLITAYRVGRRGIHK